MARSGDMSVREATKDGAQSEERESIVTSALCKAAQKLGFTQSELAEILGVSKSTASRLMKGSHTLREDQKEYEIAVIFLRIFRSLDAITGGEDRVNVSWMRNENTALSGVPAAMIKNLTGLMNVVTYLDAQRAKI
jgi:transcriptional regulator with XRE-family HTH domain